MKFKNILITGGCGFLGKHLLKLLLKEFPNSKFKVLDLKGKAFDNKRITTVLGKDITQFNTFESEFKNIDAVIHLAGIVSFYMKDKELLEHVNVIGTKNIMKAALKHKVKTVVHISSVAALGFKEGLVTEEFKFNWDIAKKKKKYYMLTKHLADLEVNKYRKKGLIINVVYPGLMYGPGDAYNTAKLIKTLREEKLSTVPPGGTNALDVRDIAKGIVLMLKSNLKNEDILLSGYNQTFEESYKIICEVQNVKISKKKFPFWLHKPLYRITYILELMFGKKFPVAADLVDSSFTFRYFDNSKAKKLLKWQPEISFEKTIRDSVKWLEKNGYFKK